MARQLQRLQLAWRFIDAIDGRTLDRRMRPELREAQALSDGECGCYLSHLLAWRTFLDESDAPHAIFLEDDSRIDADLIPVCNEIIARHIPFDIVRCSLLKPPSKWNIVAHQLSAGRRLEIPAKTIFGTNGYLLSRPGARRLLEWLSLPRRAIDVELNGFWERGIDLFLVWPPLADVDSKFETTIWEPGERKYRASGGRLAKWIYLIRREIHFWFVRIHFLLQRMKKSRPFF